MQVNFILFYYLQRNENQLRNIIEKYSEI